MSLQLFHYWRSSASYRVRIALGLKGLAPRFHHIDLLHNAQHAPDFARHNPQQLVPVLRHEGAVLTQSLAIVDYLDEMFADPPLLPQKGPARAAARSLAHLIAMDIHPICNVGVLRQLEAQMGASPDGVSAWVRTFIAKGLGHYAARLEALPRHRFSAADTPSIADLCLVPQLYNARRWQVDLKAFPRLLEIEAHCLALDAFAAAHPDRFKP